MYDLRRDSDHDSIAELETTAERVERFRIVHEDAVRDLRERIVRARREGHDHDEIERAIQRARESVQRIERR